MEITQIDHLVLTVRDIETTVKFYQDILGMQVEEFSNGRTALKFGTQKINLHEYGAEFEPKAHLAVPGSADLCFCTQIPIDQAMINVRQQGIRILQGPVKRTGANGPILSFYFRDPDLNLIEVSNYLPAT